MYKIAFKKFLFIFVVSFIFAIFLGLYLKNQNLQNSFDYKFMKFFQENNVFLKSDISFFIVKSITFLGESKFYIIFGVPILIFLTIKKEYKIIFTILVAILLSWMLNTFLKKLICRIRPVDFFVIYEKNFSYPSGHSMIGSSFYLTLGYLISEKLNKKVFYIFLILAILIAFSRIILGVHWLTDIFVGFYLGYLCYCVAIKYYRYCLINGRN